MPGKQSKRDVQKFSRHFADNIVSLHEDFVNMTYRHGGYEHFKISDPKPRDIHKATVRDRLVHHAIYRVLYPFFSRTFIADSYSCQLDKGTHRATRRFRQFSDKASKNNTKTVWILKCDIKKFFASIDQTILLKQLKLYIPDLRIVNLLEEVISSFSWQLNKGLPLGNLTSQLFVNIYMTPLDQFMKHKLKAKYYLRYADDFVIESRDKKWLESLIPKIKGFLMNNLKLQLHSKKVIIQNLASGVDFLGWVHFPNHRVLRTTTKRRMSARIKVHPTNETLQSYLGLLSHGNTHKIKTQILNDYFLSRGE
ncbi:MAG: reverse transcriptase/maturase family protein [Patescibacteria group bacterium]